MYLGSSKESVSVFPENFEKKLMGVFKNVSMKFCLANFCCMDLIAATRAEGGLVL